MSTAESEYSTAAIAEMASAHVRYVNDDFKCLGKPYEHRNGSDDSHLPPAIILTENTTAVSMTESLKPSSHTRHIERHYHYIREGTHRKLIKMVYVSNKVQVADMGTKSLDGPDFHSMTDYFMYDAQHK